MVTPDGYPGYPGHARPRPRTRTRRVARATRSFLQGALVAACILPARAGMVYYRLYNRTGLTFDYSLQLGNYVGFSYVLNRSFAGKASSALLTDKPIIPAFGDSPDIPYHIAEPGQSDAVAFNMRTPDGEEFGLRFKSNLLSMFLTAHDMHYCQLPPKWNGERISFTLQPSHGPGNDLELLEALPDGERCTFGVTQGYGPQLWSEPPLTVRYRFENQTRLRFDYTLQMGNTDSTYDLLGNPSFRGESSNRELTTKPGIGPGGRSGAAQYVIGNGFARDALAFSMLTPTGRRYGLGDGIRPEVRSCSLPRSAAGKQILVVLQPTRVGQGLELQVREPGGKGCTFGVEPGTFGPSLWLGPMPQHMSSLLPAPLPE